MKNLPNTLLALQDAILAKGKDSKHVALLPRLILNSNKIKIDSGHEVYLPSSLYPIYTKISKLLAKTPLPTKQYCLNAIVEVAKAQLNSPFNRVLGIEESAPIKALLRTMVHPLVIEYFYSLEEADRIKLDGEARQALIEAGKVIKNIVDDDKIITICVSSIANNQRSFEQRAELAYSFLKMRDFIYEKNNDNFANLLTDVQMAAFNFLRAVSRIKKCSTGNCGEFSWLTLYYLLDNQSFVNAYQADLEGSDHNYVIADYAENSSDIMSPIDIKSIVIDTYNKKTYPFYQIPEKLTGYRNDRVTLIGEEQPLDLSVMKITIYRTMDLKSLREVMSLKSYKQFIARVDTLLVRYKQQLNTYSDKSPTIVTQSVTEITKDIEALKGKMTPHEDYKKQQFAERVDEITTCLKKIKQKLDNISQKNPQPRRHGNDFNGNNMTFFTAAKNKLNKPTEKSPHNPIVTVNRI